MPLTFAQKSSVRRHLGYPVVGLLQISPAGGSVASGMNGYRFFQTYGRLEYKMNNLNPDEEARLTGRAYAAVALIGPQPNAGDTISVTLSGGGIASPQTVTVTAPAPQVNVDGRLTLGALLAAAASQNTVLQAAGVISVTPYGSGPFNEQQIPTPEVAFSCPQAFTITSAASGVLFPQITATGAMLHPSASLDGSTTIYGYIPILDGLESALAGASQNLDTIQAAVWRGRSNEIGQRMSLYKNWVGLMSDFLGIPTNADKYNKASNYGALRYM